jgi:hypothetical protein
MTYNAVLSNMHVVSYFRRTYYCTSINIDVASDSRSEILRFFIGISSKSRPHNHILLNCYIFSHLNSCKVSSQLGILQYNGFALYMDVLCAFYKSKFADFIFPARDMISRFLEGDDLRFHIFNK